MDKDNVEQNKIEKSITNKKLVVAVIVLTILVILLGGFMIYDKVIDNKTPQKESEKNDNKVSQRKVGDCYKVDGNERCVILKEGNIELSSEYYDKDWINFIYYINDIKINDDISYCPAEEAKVIDGRYIILNCGDDRTDAYFYNSKAESKPLDFSNISGLGQVDSIEYSDGVIRLFSLDYGYDYEAALCRDKEEDDIVYIEQEIKYIGDGKFSEPKTIKTYTAKDIIKMIYNMTCDELKNTNDPDLEYDRDLANGE